MNMLNGDEAMSPAEFAKLMGAYPQPAENPLPAYGGYMDNSPANFAWVNNNAYFGAEGGRHKLPLNISIDTSGSTMDGFSHSSQEGFNKSYRKMAIDAIKQLNPPHVVILEHNRSVETVYEGDAQGAIQFINDENNLQPSGGTAPMGRIVEAISTLQGHKMILTDGDWVSVESAIRMAEGEKKNCGCGQDPCITYGAESWEETDQYTIEYLMGYGMNVSLTDRVREMVNDEDIDLDTLEWFINNMTIPFGDREEALEIITEAKSAETFGAEDDRGDLMDNEHLQTQELKDMWFRIFGDSDTNQKIMEDKAKKYHYDVMGIQGPIKLKARLIYEMKGKLGMLESQQLDWDTYGEDIIYEPDTEEELGLVKEAPYGGAGALMDIGKDTPLADFTGKELAESSAIHGDFDQASLNYSGHQNLEVRAEDYEGPMTHAGAKDYVNALENKIDGGMKDEGFFPAEYEDFKEVVVEEIGNHTEYSPWHEQGIPTHHDYQNAEDGMTAMQISIGCPSGSTKDFTRIFDVNVRGSDLEYLTSELEDEVKGRVASWNKTYDAEMEELTENMVEVTNRFDDSVGRIHVEDVEGDIDDIESVDVSLEDMDGDMIASFTMSDEYIPEELDDYLQDQYATETKKGMWVGLASLAIGTLAYLNRDSLTSSVKRVFNNETQEMLENDPELIENPDIGNLDPAQYEELVVQSTGYAVDVIPVGLDGSFMGSRFAALPTERYVEYNDPGIGAHTDIAMNRDEIYLEPEMAMVQASENVIKEAQAPGQSPYNSITGEENPDFDYRVIKETHPISLDPAVKPFIPQSMAGYTGNANTPPSVMNKMFNIGVLGQTPAFVPGSSDMGANHFGSRNATPNTLGLGGVVGGPLSDQVNASYTDGTTSMSLAQWSIENTVSQTSDTEAVVIDRSSGLMKRVRRV